MNLGILISNESVGLHRELYLIICMHCIIPKLLTQGTILDRIDYNLEMTVEHIDKGNVELEKVRFRVN